MTSDIPASCDVAVIGAGPGGYDCALACAELGLDTVLVEARDLGGTCLNWGCIPTKLFLGATEYLAGRSAMAKLKLITPSGNGPCLDLDALQLRRTRLVEGTRKAMAKRIQDMEHLRLIQARASIAGAGIIALELPDGGTAELACERMVVATGSRPGALPGIDFTQAGAAVLNSDQALALTELPEDMIVVGGGAIGLEMSEFLLRLGVKITLVEAMDRLAPTEDPEISKTLASHFKRAGAKIITGDLVSSLGTEDGRAVMTLASGKELSAEKALLAAGRLPNTQGLGLETLGAELRGPGFAVVDDHLRTAEHVYAIGDVNGLCMLAHAASHQGEYLARLLAGKDAAAYAPGSVPACIYGSCEAMRVGPTEAALKEQGHPITVSRSMLAANPIAQSHGASQGLVKVAWNHGRVASISAAGHGVSHLVGMATIMVSQAWSKEQAEDMIFAHPTLDEALRHALLAPAQ